MTKSMSDRGYGFTPGGWKFLAVMYAFLVVHNNLADAHSLFTWIVFGVSTSCAVLLALLGHRPSPRKLWRDKPPAATQREGEDG